MKATRIGPRCHPGELTKCMPDQTYYPLELLRGSLNRTQAHFIYTYPDCHRAKPRKAYSPQVCTVGPFSILIYIKDVSRTRGGECHGRYPYTLVLRSRPSPYSMKGTAPVSVALKSEELEWSDRSDLIEVQSSYKNYFTVVSRSRDGLATIDCRIWIPPTADRLKLKPLTIAHAGTTGHRGVSASLDVLRVHFNGGVWKQIWRISYSIICLPWFPRLEETFPDRSHLLYSGFVRMKFYILSTCILAVARLLNNTCSSSKMNSVVTASYLLLL